MNKEDILKKSRQENKNGDEREQKIQLRSDAISSAIGGLICMVFVFLESYLFDRSAAMIWAIYSGMMFSQSIMNAVKLKRRIDIVLSVIWGIVLILNIVFYILDNIGIG